MFNQPTLPDLVLWNGRHLIKEFFFLWHDYTLNFMKARTVSPLDWKVHVKLRYYIFSTRCPTLLLRSAVMAGTSIATPASPLLVSLWSPPSVALGLDYDHRCTSPACAAGDCAQAGDPDVGFAPADLGFLSLEGWSLNSAHLAIFLHLFL